MSPAARRALPTRRLALAGLLALAATGSAAAQPAPVCDEAAVKVVRNNLARVASARDVNLVLIDGAVFHWRNGEAPRKLAEGAVHVAMAADRAYAIDAGGRLLAWPADGSQQPKPMLDGAAYAVAGSGGILAIRCDGSLWSLAATSPTWAQIAPLALHAWAGDGTDYYIDPDGGLFVSGAADRGQYGDGLFGFVAGWTKVAQPAARVVSAGGHSLYLDHDGTLMGAGDNAHGALGPASAGDRLGTWTGIFSKATDMSTGGKVSAALRADNSLWAWGGAAGPEPRRILDRVAEAAAGDEHVVALKRDGTVWTWRAGEEPRPVKLP